METAVLFLVFNRPETTARVFQAIREAKPPRLYVAADGPHHDRPAERETCRQVRSIATSVDWPCEVFTLFRNENLGCKLAVCGAIDWFFGHEESGIILEDDCLPAQSFFRFCEELLSTYRHDERIMHIGGSNPIADKTVKTESYYFSIYNRIWGWATWKRAWQHNDVSISKWPELKKSQALKKYFNKRVAASYAKIFDAVYSGKIDTWDYQWFLSRLIHGVSIISTRNLVSNIGFGANATHTRDGASFYANLPVVDVSFPLVHPQEFRVNKEWDDYWASKHVLGGRFSIRNLKTLFAGIFK